MALAGLVLLPGCVERPSATDAAFSESGWVIAMSGGAAGAKAACFTCHGLQGQGDGEAAPRLAGLEAGYLQKQLADYAASTRPDDLMTPIAKRLDDDAMRAVAAYYAALPLAGARTAPRPPAPAAYLAGGAQSCAACHGLAGEGAGPGNPAIAGQPASFIVEQLQRWRRAERRNDPQNVMGRAAGRLSDAEVQALADWLAAASASPPPESAAASGSAAG
jgi:cytochrome c553